MTVLTALITSSENAGFSEPICFQADTECCACWKLLCTEAPGVADRSPEGNKERWAPHDEVYTALPQRGLPSEILRHWCQDFLAEAFLAKMMICRSAFGSEDFDLECCSDSKSF